jgi:hypothetical protein
VKYDQWLALPDDDAQSAALDDDEGTSHYVTAALYGKLARALVTLEGQVATVAVEAGEDDELQRELFGGVANELLTDIAYAARDVAMWVGRDLPGGDTPLMLGEFLAAAGFDSNWEKLILEQLDKIFGGEQELDELTEP